MNTLIKLVTMVIRFVFPIRISIGKEYRYLNGSTSDSFLNHFGYIAKGINEPDKKRIVSFTILLKDHISINVNDKRPIIEKRIVYSACPHIMAIIAYTIRKFSLKLIYRQIIGKKIVIIGIPRRRKKAQFSPRTSK